MDDGSDDAGLVHAIATRGHGAREAEATLCHRFGPRARLYGLKHLRDDQRARDLAQAVLLALLEAARAGRIDDPLRVDRFVLGTCRNVALRMRANDARARPTDTAELDVMAWIPEPEALGAAALSRCLAELEGRERQVVYLSFHKGKGAGEIASTLGTTAGNVRVLRHRAVAQLRRCIDDCKEVEP